MGVGTVTMWKSAAARSAGVRRERQTGPAKFLGLDLACAIVMVSQLADPGLIDVEGNDRAPRQAECNGNGQANVTEANDGNLAGMCGHVVYHDRLEYIV